MEDPVFTTTGHTYERSFIEEWFRKGNKTDPNTNEKVANLLIPNHALRKAIQQWLSEEPMRLKVHENNQKQHQSEEFVKERLCRYSDELRAKVRALSSVQCNAVRYGVLSSAMYSVCLSVCLSVFRSFFFSISVSVSVCLSRTTAKARANPHSAILLFSASQCDAVLR